MAVQRDCDAWQGTVKILFQPAEEGGAGAAKMVAEGPTLYPIPYTRPLSVSFSLCLWQGTQRVFNA